MVARAKVEEQPPLVAMISLGCAKNLVDTEIMLGALLRDGFHLTTDPQDADVLLVNTCSFIDAAKEESIDAILESARRRQEGQRSQALVVTGCLPQRFQDRLPNLLPEVDAFAGIDDVPRISEIVRSALMHRAGRVRGARKTSRPTPEVLPSGDSRGARVRAGPLPRYLPDREAPRLRLTPSHYAYVKIAEGCNHPCSFCTIPRIRGRFRSRQPADLIEECRGLLADGVKELNLISQDSTYYGTDLRRSRGGSNLPGVPAPDASLPGLLRQLNALPGDFWIRVLYTHPAHWTDELISAFAECRKVARYVDVPLQHIHDTILERMRRRTTREQIVDLVCRIRAGIPGVTLRTTFIVGFPGETEACFESLLDFIRETRFDRVGVFTYSQEEGTVAARMADQVPRRVRERRRDLAMAAQLEVARGVAAAQAGRELKVLVEKEARTHADWAPVEREAEHGWLRGRVARPMDSRGRCLVARSEADAPEVDGRVFVKGRARAGEFAQVRIVGHTDYDLIGELVTPHGKD